jgi:hypothetical protein
MSLKAFTRAVNKLADTHCARINARKPLFAARHFPYDESFLAWYHKAGFTPVQTHRAILDECESEAKWEARVS